MTVSLGERTEAMRQMVGTEGCDLDVNGPSMLPTLRSEDRIRVTRDRMPHHGELGLFVNHGGDLVAHRLLARLGNHSLFRGDNRTLPDRPVKQSQVIGRVTGTVQGCIHEPIRSCRGLARLAYYRKVISQPFLLSLRLLTGRTHASS